MPDESGELLRYPSGRVSAVLDTPEELRAALRLLESAEFPDDAVMVLCGEAGARRIDSSGEHHGLSGRLTRATEHLFADVREMEEAERALREGKFVAAVLAPAEDEAARAADALRSAGGHHLVRFGRWTTTHLPR